MMNHDSPFSILFSVSLLMQVMNVFCQRQAALEQRLEAHEQGLKTQNQRLEDIEQQIAELQMIDRQQAEEIAKLH